MHRQTWQAIAIVASLAIVLVACPADDPVIDGPEADSEETVTISGNRFTPGTLEVEAGTTVTFVNEDSVQHTVTAGAPGEETGEFDEALPGRGDTVEITFDAAGSFAYFCRVHPNMTAEVEVARG